MKGLIKKIVSKVGGGEVLFDFKFFAGINGEKSSYGIIARSGALSYEFVYKVINGLSHGNKVNLSFFNDAKVGDKRTLDLDEKAKQSLLLGLPKMCPSGTVLLTKELKEVEIERVKDGFCFNYRIEGIREL